MAATRACREPADGVVSPFSGMSYFYSGFGLSIQADAAIPGMTPVAEPRSIDTHVWLSGFPAVTLVGEGGEVLWFVSEPEESGEPALRAWRMQDGRHFRLAYLDGTEFLIDRTGANVWARWRSSSTLADTATYLLGPVFGFVLRLRSVTCLHGSAVAVRDAVIALVGPQGSGKSTTAAAFSQLGHPVLADDIVAVVNDGGSWHVHPTYPQLRLWPDSVAALCGRPDALPPLTPTWDKRGLDLTGPAHRFERRRLPLAAIYLLGSGASPGTGIQGLHGRSSLLALLGNTYVSYLLEKPMRAQEFEDLASLNVNVPVRRVALPRDLSDVSGLCSAILADCESLACTA